MKALVISGGGSWGAFTVGRISFVKKEYDLAIGCSTGSLIAPFALLGKYDLLKEAYSSVNNESVFNVNPFNKKGHIKILNSLIRLIRGKRTLGENENLLKLIKKYYTLEIHNEILLSGKDFIVTVCNISKTPYSTKYVSIKDCGYDTFIKYIWASCSVPIVTSIVEINGEEYVDGGVTEGVPLSFILNKDPDEVDVYLHEIDKKQEKISFITDIFHFTTRLINIMRQEIRNDDLKKYNSNNDTSYKLSLKYIPKELPKSALFFDKELMTSWIKEGEEYECSLYEQNNIANFSL